MKKNKSENIPVDFSILNDMPTDFKIDRITREAGFQRKPRMYIRFMILPI